MAVVFLYVSPFPGNYVIRLSVDNKKWLPIEKNCQKFDGHDLISGTLPDDLGMETIFIPARKDSTHRLEDQIMIKVDRKKSLRDEIFNQLQ